ncbi:recombinase family protein [Streptosporangium sp. NPDC023615]|uniref:recombinase family protein n=1 Tax=Streptosporangium sp. NPDC023615 TaxID=3154794 RepID=UPI003419C139
MSRVLEKSIQTTKRRMTVDYSRISHDKRGAGEGVETQQHENEMSADELGETISHSYVDNDVSAFSGVERPDYMNLLADMEADRIGLIIVRHADRLHRSVEEVSRFIKIARAHNVKLYSGMKGSFYNLNKAAGRKDLINDTLNAEYESDHRGERVTDARKRQARQGVWGGGVRPYGWGVDTGRVRSVCVNPKAPVADRVYEDRPVLDMSQHNPKEAAEIKRWEQAVLAGIPMNQILADLARRNVPTPAETDGRTLRRKGKEIEIQGWHSRTIIQILTNPRVSGHTVYNGEIVKRNAYTPIIEEDRRQAIITIFKDPARKTAAGNTPKWLNSLIAQCGLCNDGSTGRVRYIAGSPYYRCGSKGHCSTPAIETDRYVQDVMIARLSRADVAELLPTTRPDLDIQALRDELVTLEAQKQDAALLFGQRAIDASQLATITATLEARISAIHADLSEASAQSPLADFVSTTDVAKTWESLTLGHKREIIKLLATITLVPVGRGRRPPIHERVIITPRK